MKKITAVFCVLTLILAVCVPASAADYETLISPEGRVYSVPGEDVSSRSFVWFSGEKDASFSLCGEDVPVKTERAGIKNYRHTAALGGLADGEYTYCAGGTEGSFSVNAAGPVMFCSDPQIGRSGGDSPEAVVNDTAGWEKTLDSAYAKGASLVVCAGDQVNDGFSEEQYNAFLYPPALRSVPVAAAAGNHDFYSALYGRYFGKTGAKAGIDDYYFVYGDILFIVLDSNDIVSAVHSYTMKKAVAAHPDCAFRVAVMHHSPYSADTGEFSNYFAGRCLNTLFEKYDTDLVLTGHDHFYSRAENGGTVYLQAGSASGGKCGHFADTQTAETVFFYDIGGSGSYSLISADGNGLTVNSYVTETDEMFDSFTLSARTDRAEAPVFTVFDRVAAWWSMMIAMFSNIGK